MKRPVVFLVTLVLLLLALPAGAAFGMPFGPTAPSGQLLGHFRACEAPGQFDLVQMGHEFAPAAWTPLQAHGGETFYSLEAGEITLATGGGHAVYRAGDTWSQPAGQAYTLSNWGEQPATLFATVLLSQGSELTREQPAGWQTLEAAPFTAALIPPWRVAEMTAPKRPVVRFTASFPVTKAAGSVELWLASEDYAPGQWTEVHRQLDRSFSLVMEGALTVTGYGTGRTYQAGESWTGSVGEIHGARNSTWVPAQLLTTFLMDGDPQAMACAADAVTQAKP